MRLSDIDWHIVMFLLAVMAVFASITVVSVSLSGPDPGLVEIKVNGSYVWATQYRETRDGIEFMDTAGRTVTVHGPYQIRKPK